MTTAPSTTSRTTRATRRARTALGAGLAATLAGGLVVAASPGAHATPGHPGVPADAPVVFHEDFERAPDSGPRTMLDAYGGGLYTADPYWMNATKANGMVLSWGNTAVKGDGTGAQNGTEDTAFATLRQLAEAIGTVNGSTDPRTNTVVSAYTQSKGDAPAGGKVMFATTPANPVTVPDGNGRFLAFSMSAAAANCRDAAHPDRRDPQYALFVAQDGVETALSTSPINPCKDPRARAVPVSKLANGTTSTVFAGQFASEHSFLYDGEEFGFVIRNTTSEHLGDDGAFDDIKVLDVTPQLDKAFGVSQAATGESVRLTFTVTNTAELANKKGWAFTDALPAGLVVADVPNLVVDGTATVVAEPGSDAVTVTAGDLEAGDAALTIALDVTSTVAGTYTNGPANITVRKGLDAPDSTTVTFVDPAPATGSLIVRHVDEHGEDLVDPATTTEPVGTTYGTDARSFPGYELVEVTGATSGTYAEGTTEVVYVYRPVPAPKVGDLVVRYVDEHGVEVAGTDRSDGTPGDAYDTTAKDVPGYTLVTRPENAAGRLVEGTTEVVYVYTKDVPAPGPADLTVRWVAEDGTPLADRLDRTGVVGEDYTTEARSFDGYTLVAVPTNATGTLAVTPTEVVYVYRKDVPAPEPTPAPAPADLTVRFVDEAGNPLADPTHRDGTQGEHYDTTPAALAGYELVAVPANASGEMEPGTEVVYVYRKLDVTPPTEPPYLSEVLAAPDATTTGPQRLASTGSPAGALGGLALVLALAGTALHLVHRRGGQKEA
ncbi:MucBP domain-containing protein [Cellulomonas biazotea]|uniref:Gram-positive cocci surface proteins LPxTG domain-containing protein n=1 Tax=Cellulomonas biazotea TaxID=1709 RepID=A0A402DPL7_9CELL|nr:MucBP domain-containing protein [Cellulomonas biazotea]GCE76092.1 hypothetical protein CBZ_11480 [Cellulomonas biazotea]